LYKADTDTRAVQESGSDSYLFPRLPIGLSENDASELNENATFKRLSFGSDDNVSTEFKVTFDAPEETPDDADGPVATHEEQVDEIRQQAYANGFVEGEKAGMEAEKAKFKEVTKTLHTVISELDSAKRELTYDAEKQAVELALMIAKKIVCREVSIDQDTIFRVLHRALEKVGDQENLHIKIHPADLQAIERAELEVSSLTATQANVILEPADTICRGECIIETNLGIIDARMESQLQTVEASLRRALQEGAMES